MDWNNVISMMSNMSVGSNRNLINCKNIEKQLKKHDLKVRLVSRHHLFNDYLYIIKLDNHGNRDEIYEALDIPHDWVQIYSTEGDEWEWAVDENKLNEKYCDEDGILDFSEEFDFFDALKYRRVDEIKRRAEAKEVSYDSSAELLWLYYDSEICIVKDLYAILNISGGLNSWSQDFDNKIVVINVREVKTGPNA